MKRKTTKTIVAVILYITAIVVQVLALTPYKVYTPYQSWYPPYEWREQTVSIGWSSLFDIVSNNTIGTSKNQKKKIHYAIAAVQFAATSIAACGAVLAINTKEEKRKEDQWQ